MEKSNLYKSFTLPEARRLLEVCSISGVRNHFFDRAEQDLLSLLMIYFIKTLKEPSNSNVLRSVYEVLETLKTLPDFHNLMINSENPEISTMYSETVYFGTYREFNKRSIGMSEEEALEENDWLFRSFNVTLMGLEHKLKATGIERLIEIERIQSTVATLTENIMRNKVLRDGIDKGTLIEFHKIYNMALMSNLIIKDELQYCSLAYGIVQRELSK